MHKAIAHFALLLTLFVMILCVIVMQSWAVWLDDHWWSFTVLLKFLTLFKRNKNEKRNKNVDGCKKLAVMNKRKTEQA